MKTVPIITMFDSNYVAPAAACFVSMYENFAKSTSAPLSVLSIENMHELNILNSKNMLGSETAGFASGEVLSKPCTCDASLAGRSVAKSVKRTKTNSGRGNLTN